MELLFLNYQAATKQDECREQTHADATNRTYNHLLGKGSSSDVDHFSLHAEGLQIQVAKAGRDLCQNCYWKQQTKGGEKDKRSIATSYVHALRHRKPQS